MPAQPIPPQSALRARLNKFLYAPATEFVLVGLILLSVLLIFVEIGSGPDRLGYGRLMHLQAGLTVIFWLELGLRCWAANRAVGK